VIRACLEHVESEELVGEFLSNLIHVDAHVRHVRTTQLVRRLLHTHTPRSTVLARWRQHVPSSDTWFLGPARMASRSVLPFLHS